jgi:hypothetical protein
MLSLFRELDIKGVLLKSYKNDSVLPPFAKKGSHTFYIASVTPCTGNFLIEYSNN